MANQPRADNPHRMVRVDDVLWRASEAAAERAGTTRSEVMRAALAALVEADGHTNGHTSSGHTPREDGD